MHSPTPADVSVSQPSGVVALAGGTTRQLAHACFTGCATRGVGRALGRTLRDDTAGAGALAALRLTAATDWAGLLAPDAVIRLLEQAAATTRPQPHPPVWAGYPTAEVGDTLGRVLAPCARPVTERLLASLLDHAVACPPAAYPPVPTHPPLGPVPGEHAESVAAAADRRSPPERLWALAGHRAVSVRKRVAANPAAPAAALDRLVPDKNRAVWRLATTHQCCPPAALDRAARRLAPSDPLGQWLASRPTLPPETCRRLAATGNAHLARALARNPHAPAAHHPQDPVVARVAAASPHPRPARSPRHRSDLADTGDEPALPVPPELDRLDGLTLPLHSPPWIRVRPIRTPAELRDNAAAMRNCTHAYHTRLRRGHGVLLALDDLTTGQRRYNASLHPTPSGYHLADIEGPRNDQSVHPAVRRDLTAYVADHVRPIRCC